MNGITSIGSPGPSGIPGGNGPSGTNGVPGAAGQPGALIGKNNYRPPTPGVPGGNGNPGASGGLGGNGSSGNSITFYAGTISGTLILYANGGDGGNGGAGGQGGSGGPGGAGISKYIAPRALLWFRWAAVATWLTGAAYLIRGANFVNAFTFGHFGEDIYGLVIGTGAWLGTIMLFNVWVLINPNQMKVLGFTPATDEEKVRARRVALLASRRPGEWRWSWPWEARASSGGRSWARSKNWHAARTP